MTGENTIFEELGKIIGEIEKESDGGSDDQIFDAITTIRALATIIRFFRYAPTPVLLAQCLASTERGFE